MALLKGGLTIPQLSSDPVENPDAGTVFLYSVGGSYRMKLSNGTIMTFATGITPEDVQDIVGTFIQAGSSKISVAYNDTLNVLTIDVVEANITLTKSQVGLPNVDNTSDANKPISNATQSALNAKENTGVAASLIAAHEASPNPHSGYATDSELSAGLALKYDVSNPSGFETPAQLNARDTANRSRANHTGTQLAATISDFATTVINTVLTGFAVGANTAIAAADTILVAFGKVQSQINFINSVLQTLVLGDQFEDFEDNTAFTTTSNANQVAASFVTASKPLGRYRIAIEWDWSFNSTNNDSIYSVYLDGVQVSQEFRYELSDAATQLLNNHFKFYSTFATVQTHTLELRCRAETNGSTVTVSRVRAEIWRATP